MTHDVIVLLSVLGVVGEVIAAALVVVGVLAATGPWIGSQIAEFAARAFGG